jgi:hypothetical protein
MLIIVIVIAAVVVGSPLIAAALVTFASLREDAAHSLGGRPPGLIAATVRRLLGNVAPARPSASRRRHRRPGNGRPDLAGLVVPPPRRSAEDDPATSTLTGPLA